MSIKNTYPYVKSIGGYNTMPEPYEKVDISEFWNHYFIWGAKEEEFRQVNLDQDNPMALRSAKVYWFHDTAFALVSRVENGKYVEPEAYRIGCKHKYKSETIGRCLTKYTCEICGHSQTVDSSD